MTTKSTSFRISDQAKQDRADRAAREGVSATVLLERLIVEGVHALDHPGIGFRGPPRDRRAAIAAGSDVWEASPGCATSTEGSQGACRTVSVWPAGEHAP